MNRDEETSRRHRMNFIGVVRLFDVSDILDKVSTFELLSGMDSGLLCNLCEALEVGFQVRVLSEWPADYRSNFFAILAELPGQRSSPLQQMFNSRLNGRQTSVGVEEGAGFADYASFLALARDLMDEENIEFFRSTLCRGPWGLARKLSRPLPAPLIYSGWLLGRLARIGHRAGMDGLFGTFEKDVRLREGLAKLVEYSVDFRGWLDAREMFPHFQSVVWHYVAPRLVYIPQDRDPMGVFWEEMLEELAKRVQILGPRDDETANDEKESIKRMTDGYIAATTIRDSGFERALVSALEASNTNYDRTQK